MTSSYRFSRRIGEFIERLHDKVGRDSQIATSSADQRSGQTGAIVRRSIVPRDRLSLISDTSRANHKDDGLKQKSEKPHAGFCFSQKFLNRLEEKLMVGEP